MELGTLVALGPAGGVLGLAGAELAEVLGRLGDYILEQLKGDAAEGFALGEYGISMSTVRMLQEGERVRLRPA
jgi:hypothetical protein